jgi:ankyrin repeat protein
MKQLNKKKKILPIIKKIVLTTANIKKMFGVVVLICFLFVFLNDRIATAEAAMEDFFKLCATGTVEEIQSAIKKGANVKARNQNGWNSLMEAARSNSNAEAISALIKAGSDVNVRTQDGWTPLIQAAVSNRNPEVISALINAGSDVSAQAKNGWDALMYASYNTFNPEIVLVLLKSGADVHARATDGATALMLAANRGKLEVISLLLKAGADVNARLGESNLSPGEIGWTALMLAAYGTTNSKVITALLEAGADVNAESLTGVTSLIIAAGVPDFRILEPEGKVTSDPKSLSNHEVITALLKGGADPDVISRPFEWTALMWALMHNKKLEVIEALIKGGADVNIETNNGSTALICAGRRDSKIISALIKAGANLNNWREPKTGKTSLMIFASDCTPEILTLLLDAGADAKAQDNQGKRAIDYAAKNEKLKGTDVYWRLNDLSY